MALCDGVDGYYGKAGEDGAPEDVQKILQHTEREAEKMGQAGQLRLNEHCRAAVCMQDKRGEYITIQMNIHLNTPSIKSSSTPHSPSHISRSCPDLP